MKQIVSKIWSSPSVRNVGKLLSANVIAQALGVLVYPVLTRLYGPEDFALLSLFTSIVGVLTLISTAEYQYSIVLPKKDSQARSLVHLCFLLLLVVAILICLSIPLAKPIAAMFKAPELAKWWWLIPFSVFGLGLWNILNYWYIRRSEFQRISGYQITQSVFSVSAKISFGLLGWLSGGMIFATVLAPLMSLLISSLLSWRKHLRELMRWNIPEIKTMFSEYSNFPKFNLPRALINSVGQSLPVWLLTPHFGLTEVGRLSLALMAAFVPLNIIARACYQVLYQRVAEYVQLGQGISNVLWRFFLLAGGSLVILLIVVYIFVPQLVTWIFGSDWIETAKIIRTLYPYLILMPICGTICFLSDVFAKQKVAMWMEFGYVLAVAGALFVGIMANSFLTAVSAYAWVGFAYHAIQLGWFSYLVRKYQRTL